MLQISTNGEVLIMKDNNCIFCKIISGEFSSYTLYEDDDLLLYEVIKEGIDGLEIFRPDVLNQNLQNIYVFYQTKIL